MLSRAASGHGSLPSVGCRAWQLPSGLWQVIAKPNGHTLALQIRDDTIAAMCERMPKGFFTLFCVRCGSYATKKLRRLLLACKSLGRGQSYGAASLRRIAAGGHPAVPRKKRAAGRRGHLQKLSGHCASISTAPALSPLPGWATPSPTAVGSSSQPSVILRFAETCRHDGTPSRKQEQPGGGVRDSSNGLGQVGTGLNVGNRDSHNGHSPEVDEEAALEDLLELEADGLRVSWPRM